MNRKKDLKMQKSDYTYLKKFEYREKALFCNILKSETFIYSRFIKCKVCFNFDD